MRLSVTQYYNIFIFLVVGAIIGFASIAAGLLLAPREFNEEKISSYECGFDPFDDARAQLNIRFYLVSILFIIFDIEVVFLFPLAVNAYRFDFFTLCGVFLFLFILIVGFIYEWNVGALEWE